MDTSRLFISKENLSIVKKLYISDSDDIFVDFSNKLEDTGANRLLTFGSIDIVVERTFRHFYNKTGVINLRNNDGFFDKPFPVDTKFGWVLKRPDGTLSSFLKASTGVINVFSSKLKPTKVRVAIEVSGLGMAPVEFVMGTFLFTKIETSSDSEIAALSVDSLTKKLQKTKADLIKDGFNNWYRSTPISFLIRKILEKSFGVYDYSTFSVKLPSGFILPRFKDLVLDMDESVFSSLGRSPNQEDRDDDGEPDYFPQLGLVPRAVAIHGTNVYFGLDGQLWKLDTVTMLWSLICNYQAIYDNNHIITKLQVIGNYLYVWFRKNMLHDIIDTQIDAFTPNNITDEKLRQITQKIVVRDLVNNTNTIIKDWTIFYDTEFSYYPSIGYRFSGIQAEMGAVTCWTQICMSLYGNINMGLDHSTSDYNEVYLAQQLPQQIYAASYPQVGGGNLPILSGSTLASNIFRATQSQSTLAQTIYIVGDAYDYFYSLESPSTQTLLLNLTELSHSTNLNTCNIPIPFKQRIFVNGVGSTKEISSNDINFHSIQFMKIGSIDGDITQYTKNLIDSVNTNLDKEIRHELGRGYYSALGVQQINNIRGNTGSPNLEPNNTKSYYILNNCNKNRDIKFSLGQAGINKIISYSGNNYLITSKTSIIYGCYQELYCSYLQQYSLPPKYNDVKFYVMLNSRMTTGNNPGVSNTFAPLTFCNIEINTIGTSTGSLNNLYTLKNAHIRGMEFQPTCIVNKSDSPYFVVFGYCTDALSNRGNVWGNLLSGGNEYIPSTMNLNGVATYDYTNSLTQKRMYGVALNIYYDKDYNHGYSFQTTSDSPNNKASWSGYQTHFILLDPNSADSSISDLLKNSFINISDGTTDHTVFVFDITRFDDNGTKKITVHYEDWGLWNDNNGSNPFNIPSIYPFGDFRSKTVRIIAKIASYKTVNSVPKYWTELGINSWVFKTILDAVEYEGYIYAVQLNMDEIDTSNQYEIIKVSYSNINETSAISIKSFTTQPKNLKIGASGKLYFTIEEYGKVAYIDIENSYAYYEYSTGDPAINGEPFTNGDIALFSDNGTTADIFGYSSPSGQDRTQYKQFAGKYFTWRLSNKYYPIVELADFSGMSCDDALDKLAESIYWTKGFDEYGNFFQIKRQLETNASVILDLDTNSNVFTVKKTINYDDIANRLSITPYRTLLDPVSFTITERQRLEKQGLELSIDIEQRDTETKNITLICTREGKINVPIVSYRKDTDIVTDYSIQLPEEDIETCPLFKFNIFDPSLEVEVGYDTIAEATTIYLKSVFGGDEKDLVMGDYINTGGLRTGDYIFATDLVDVVQYRKITSVNIATNSITILTAFGFSIKAETVLSVIRARQKFFSDEYSAIYSSASTDGSQIFLDSHLNIAIKNIIEIALSNGETYRGLVIDKLNDSEGNQSILVSPSITPALVQANSIIKTYWSPLITGRAYEIGGTKVLVKVQTTESSVLDIVAVDNTVKPMSRTFLVGESIVISCAGLKLDQDRFSVVTQVDLNSLTKYGEMEFQNSIDNKFINKTLAKYTAKKIITENSSPKYELDIDCVFLPYLTAQSEDKRYLRKIEVISRKMFGGHLNNSITGSILDIKHNPDKRSTQISLRGEMRLDD